MKLIFGRATSIPFHLYLLSFNRAGTLQRWNSQRLSLRTWRNLFSMFLVRCLEGLY